MKKLKKWLKQHTINDLFDIAVNAIMYLIRIVLFELILMLGIFLRVTGRLW